MQLFYAILEWESYYSEYRELSEAGRVLTTCLFVCLFVCFLLVALLCSVLHSQLPPSRHRIHCVPALYSVPRPRSGLSIYVTGHHHQHHHCHNHHHRQYRHPHIIAIITTVTTIAIMIIPALFQLQPPISGLSINRNCVIVFYSMQSRISNSARAC